MAGICVEQDSHIYVSALVKCTQVVTGKKKTKTVRSKHTRITPADN